MEKAVKRAFTLLELVIVVVIISFLAVASFKGIQSLKLRAFKTKELTRLSLESQAVLDQLGALLQIRIPATTIGYDPDSAEYEPAWAISEDQKYKVLEWIAWDEDAFDAGVYSGFVDMKRSIRHYLDYTFYTDISQDLPGRALIFAGTFDRGYTSNQMKEAFGWHGSRSDLIYDISITPPHTITITDATKPKWLYEKYYLAKSAFAVARGADIDMGAQCLKNFHVDEEALLLFYDYKPWKGESFCADPNGGSQSGKAAILMRHVAGFGVREQDFTLRLVLDINKPLFGQNVGVHFSKTKVVF